jgi:calcineurin-like phosphoesterase family protein
MIHFISDTHFGHKSTLLFGRPFSSVEEMDATLIRNWNNVVKPEDTVYHLGDFAYKTSVNRICSIFDMLNGEIVFIRGNHDGRTLNANNRRNRFKSIHDRLYIHLEGHDFVLDHYPLWSWQNRKYGSIHLFGHIHQGTAFEANNMLNVSVENINYTPISIQEVLNTIKKD